MPADVHIQGAASTPFAKGRVIQADIRECFEVLGREIVGGEMRVQQEECHAPLRDVHIKGTFAPSVAHEEDGRQIPEALDTAGQQIVDGGNDPQRDVRISLDLALQSRQSLHDIQRRCFSPLGLEVQQGFPHHRLGEQPVAQADGLVNEVERDRHAQLGAALLEPRIPFGMQLLGANVRLSTLQGSLVSHDLRHSLQGAASQSLEGAHIFLSGIDRLPADVLRIVLCFEAAAATAAAAVLNQSRASFATKTRFAVKATARHFLTGAGQENRLLRAEVFILAFGSDLA